jgi:putative tricarboxylic transport membrane protein
MKSNTTLKTGFKGALLAAALAAPIALAAPAVAQEYPSTDETLDWTIAFGPGGGNDIMARSIIEILNTYDLYPGEISAENRAGGSGAVGWGYLYAQAGSAYGISTTSEASSPPRCRPIPHGNLKTSRPWLSLRPTTLCSS